LLWQGTAASVIDLGPAADAASEAIGVSGESQVGYVLSPPDYFNSHAYLWSGTAASAVDLHPAGFSDSQAYGVSGAHQVGVGCLGNCSFGIGFTRALLWTGTAASAVNLNGNLYTSVAWAVAGNTQVGAADFGDGSNRAVMWTGTAESIVDLHQAIENALGPSYYSSEAYGVDENGTIVGVAYGPSGGNAVLWTPESGVFGDYNNNGVADAADYVYWRKGSNPLHNEIATIGSNTPEDYTAWRARFGNSTPDANGAAPSTVPEPAGVSLILVACAIMMLAHRQSLFFQDVVKRNWHS
jgi:hypothetical protein